MTTSDQLVVKRQRSMLGVAYMMAMGVCGIVLVAIGSNLRGLAANCNMSATQLGTVFIARGAGAIFGAVASSKLFCWFRSTGNRVMILTLVALSILVMILPAVSDVYTMHALFAALGTCTAVIDTGCQIQTRKVHGIAAGPWLGCNTISFSLSGALVPIIALITGGSLFAQCTILSTVIIISIILMCIPKGPESLPPPKAAFAPRHRMKQKPSNTEDASSGAGAVSFAGAGKEDGATADGGEGDGSGKLSKKKSWPYVVESLAAWEVFWLIGGKVAATSYLTSYVDSMEVISASGANLLLVVLWIGISLGRLVGVFEQINLSTARLYLHIRIQLWLGASGMALVLSFPGSGPCLWIGVCVYGVSNGPTIGYIYDLCNRTTAASEKGMSIVMFGLNIGASFIPYLVSFTWDSGAGPITLPVVIMISHLLPIPCQWLIRRCTAVPGTIVTCRVAKDTAYSMCSNKSLLCFGSTTAARWNYGIGTAEEAQSLIGGD